MSETWRRQFKRWGCDVPDDLRAARPAAIIV